MVRRNSAEYERDFYAWTQQQATLLRSGKFSEIDVENVAEELESMGRSDKREIDSRLQPGSGPFRRPIKQVDLHHVTTLVHLTGYLQPSTIRNCSTG